MFEDGLPTTAMQICSSSYPAQANGVTAESACTYGKVGKTTVLDMPTSLNVALINGTHGKMLILEKVIGVYPAAVPCMSLYRTISYFAQVTRQ